MDILEIYDKVNQCKTFLELANIIRSLTDDNGKIQGRSKEFNAADMAYACENFLNFPSNKLTREYGIRQQAIYIRSKLR